MKKEYLYIVLAVILWSLNGVMVKTVGIDPIWIVFLRSLSGSCLLLPFLLKHKVKLSRDISLAGIFMAIFLLAITYTTRISTAAMAISMQYTSPLYVIIYNAFKKKKIEFNKLIIFILLLLGIVLNVFMIINFKAIISGLTIGFTFFLYTVFLKRVKGENFLGLICVINIISFIFYGTLIVAGSKSAPHNINDILIVLISGIFISAVSYSLYAMGLSKISVEKCLIICLLEPILNPILVYLVNGETVSMFTIIGLVFILTAALIDIFTSKN